MSISNYPPSQGGLVKGTDGKLYAGKFELGWEYLNSILIQGSSIGAIPLYTSEDNRFYSYLYTTSATEVFLVIVDTQLEDTYVINAFVGESSSQFFIQGIEESNGYIIILYHLTASTSIQIKKINMTTRVTSTITLYVGAVADATKYHLSMCKNPLVANELFIKGLSATAQTELVKYNSSTDIVTIISSTLSYPYIQDTVNKKYKSAFCCDGTYLYFIGSDKVYKTNLSGVQQAVTGALSFPVGTFIEPIISPDYLYLFNPSGGSGISLYKITKSTMAIASSITLTPPTGFIYVNTASINPDNSSEIIIGVKGDNPLDDYEELLFYDVSTLALLNRKTIITKEQPTDLSFGRSALKSFIFPLCMSTYRKFDVVTSGDSVTSTTQGRLTLYIIQKILKGYREVK